ncbi:MAG: hypothetical protein H6Q91_3490 [Deltaproteobacteria bacterium]|nr:hypothetical protein [Deltaproteobacteria bacterium]
MQRLASTSPSVASESPARGNASAEPTLRALQTPQELVEHGAPSRRSRVCDRMARPARRAETPGHDLQVPGAMRRDRTRAPRHDLRGERPAAARRPRSSRNQTPISVCCRRRDTPIALEPDRRLVAHAAREYVQSRARRAPQVAADARGASARRAGSCHDDSSAHVPVLAVEPCGQPLHDASRCGVVPGGSHAGSSCPAGRTPR